MSRLALRAITVAAVIALLGVGSYAIAGGGSNKFRGDPLSGYEETPSTLSTPAVGSFDARLSHDGATLEYELSYSGLEGTVLQAHIHFAKRAVNGGITLFLCGTAASPGPAGTPTCPDSGTVSRTVGAADILAPGTQGIEAGNFAELVAAMRNGSTYANVHSTKWPGGEIRAQINDR
jgi:CHRD domain